MKKEISPWKQMSFGFINLLIVSGYLFPCFSSSKLSIKSRFKKLSASSNSSLAAASQGYVTIHASSHRAKEWRVGAGGCLKKEQAV